MQTEIGTVRASDGTQLLHMWQVQVPRGDRPLRRHSHLSFEITRVTQGGGIYTVGDRQFPMEEGDMFVFASNEVHCITGVGAEGLTIVNLHFEPRYIWGNSTDSFSEQNINFCFAHDPLFLPRIPQTDNAALRRLHTEIEREFSEERAEYTLAVKSYLNLLLCELIRAYHYAKDDAYIQRRMLHAIRRVITYIDTAPANPMTLEQLAEMAGMTPNYFSSLFHKTLGIALWDYIAARRIDLATRMLRGKNGTDDDSVKKLRIIDIAETCGFNSTASFNKVFKKVTGMTPREYRMGPFEDM